MTEHGPATSTMRTVRFHQYGAPGDVLHLETVPVPDPGPGRIRVAVHACGCLPDLVRIAGGDPKRVLTISDFAAAAELGVRDTFHEDRSNRVEALPEFGQLAADGAFTVPIAATFPLDEWKTALEISQTGHARGKLLLLPRTPGPEIR